jgi:hypothetical protein
MEPENLTVRVLVEMRDEMKGMREELREVKNEVRGVKDHVRSIDERLSVMDGRMSMTDERIGVIEETMLDVASHVRMLGRATRVSLTAKRRHEQLISDLHRRVTDLERRRR